MDKSKIREHLVANMGKFFGPGHYPGDTWRLNADALVDSVAELIDRHEKPLKYMTSEEATAFILGEGDEDGS